MSANDLLTLLIRLLFVFLGILTAVDYLRHRDKPRRDIALMFGTFGVLFLIPMIATALGIQSEWTTTISNFALIAQPYLLLRLGQYFRPVPHRLMRIAQIGMVVLWIALLIIAATPKDNVAGDTASPAEAITLLALILYFGAIDGYAMLMFVRGALTSVGVVRQRLRFAAAGSGLLAATLLSLGLVFIAPASIGLVTVFVFVALTGAALTYYISFTPPRWLRRTWQFTELRSFLVRIASHPVGQRNVEEGLKELCLVAPLAVGGKAAAVAQWDDQAAAWSLRHITNPDLIVTRNISSGSRIDTFWEQRKPGYFRRSDNDLSVADRQLLEINATDTLLIAPIAAAERAWGVLLVFLDHSSLFIDDDLDLLVLLAQQSAIFLENSALVEEMHDYSGQLARLVDERTHELEKSRGEYRRIIETSQEGIWVTDVSNRTTFANARMAEMFGVSVEEMLALSPMTFVTDEGKLTARTNWQRRLQGISDQYEFVFRRKDGSILQALVAATPLLDDDGNPIGTLAMVADITDRKRAEAELMKLNAELEKRVAERTAQLSFVNRELEAFSYSVSHDLRAPLRTLDGFSRLMLENYSSQLDEKGLHYLQRIRSGSDSMAQLIDALLHLSRVSRTELRIDQANLSDMARSITTDLREQNPDRMIEFVVQEGLVARGDKALLRVVLNNLLGNAVKFTRNQPQACVEFGMTEHRGRLAYFVRDNGAGFDMTYAGKLFGAFQRLHRSDEFEGTGIGLATVERVIHRHGGEIWADAAVNKGATFYFTLAA